MVNIDYLYNPDAAKAHFSKNCFVKKELGFQVIENGMIIPHKQGISGYEFWGGGGIVDGKGQHLSNSFVHQGWGTSYVPSP